MKLFTSKGNIVISFLTGLLCLGYLAFSACHYLKKTESSEKAVQAAQQDMLVTESLMNDMQDIESGSRGYLISGNRSFLEPYYKGLQNLSKDSLLFKQPQYDQLLLPGERRKILELIRKKNDISAEGIRLKDKLGFDKAAELVQTGAGKNMMDSIRAIIQVVENKYEIFLSHAYLNQQSANRNTVSRFLILSILFFCTLLISFVIIFYNIHKKDRAETALRAANMKLEHQVAGISAELGGVFERITDAFIAVDKNFCYTYLNKRAGELIQKDPAALIGKNVWDVFPDAVGSSTWKAFKQAMDTQELVSNEDYYEPLDLWQENSIYPSPGGLSVFIRNISERKKAEHKMMIEKELSDSIINSLPGIFYLYDRNGKFIRWNRNFEIVSGYSNEEVAGMHPLDFFHESEKELLAARIGMVFVTGEAEVEAEFYTKDHQRIPYYFNGKAIAYQDKTCLIGMGIDITKRKMAEKELLLSEKKYKTLFEDNPMPLWMFSLQDLRFIAVNDAAIKHYGYSEAEFLQMTISDIRPEKDRADLQAAVSVKDGGVRKLGLWQHLKKNGEMIHVEIFSHDTMYNGEAVRLVMANDVTEKEKAQELLQHSYEEMRELASHLQDIREEERASMAREVHDQLGQLLTGIRMDISWLHKKMPADDPEIKQRMDETMDMLNDAVLSVRKIATDLRPSILDDLGLVAAMEWQCEEFERKSGILVSFDHIVGNVKIPPSYNIGLFRILQESLTNVARHSGAHHVEVNLHVLEGNLLLRIKDDGTGFDKSGIIEKKTLGLLGMEERCLMMGGSYDIDSAPGQGTVVTVRIALNKQ